LELLLGDFEEGDAEATARAVKAGAEKPVRIGTSATAAAGRRPLREHLPRETVVQEAAPVCPSCGATELRKIGEDRRQVLEYVPSHFTIVEHVRPKRSCRLCEAITQAPMPALPLERGRPGPALIAHVLVSKYCDHLPLYRQSAIYERAGVDLDRSTMADWVGGSAALFDPLRQAIARHVCAGSALHADDTPVPVRDPGRGKTKTGRLWVLVRDERPWGSRTPPAVLYRYSAARKGEPAKALLDDRRGFLHADAYAGFNEPMPPTPRPIGRG
jgi:transposase